MSRRHLLFWLGWAACVAAAAALGARGGDDRDGPGFLSRAPVGIMGTDTELRVLGDDDAPLRQAEAGLRHDECRLSAHLDRADLARINAATAGEAITVSEEVVAVLARARAAHASTDGAFDATCGPLLQVWRDAGRAGREPDGATLARARADGGWGHFTIATIAGRTTVTKDRAAARLDLGGIAKGWAVDRAIAAMRAAGAKAGSVDVGGDLRVFGPGDRADGTWTVEVAAPDGIGICAVLALTDRAVCTSGNYHRFTEISGRRHSHIVDPRTGMTADAVPSVTVVAPTTEAADIWATALSVLGPPGLALLPPEVDALLLGGITADSAVHRSPGFARWEVVPVRLPRLPPADDRR